MTKLKKTSRKLHKFADRVSMPSSGGVKKSSDSGEAAGKRKVEAEVDNAGTLTLLGKKARLDKELYEEIEEAELNKEIQELHDAVVREKEKGAGSSPNEGQTGVLKLPVLVDAVMRDTTPSPPHEIKAIMTTLLDNGTDDGQAGKC